MNTLQSSLFAVAIAFCVLGASVMARHVSARQFSLFLKLAAAGFVLEWLLIHPQVPLKALWLGLLMNVSLLMAPCLWLFARESNNRRTLPESPSASLAALGKLQWAFIMIGMLCTLPLISCAHFGTEFYRSQAPATPTVWSRFVHTTMLICVVIFAFQVPLVLRRCWYVIKTGDNKEKSERSAWAGVQLGTPGLLMTVLAVKWLVNLLRVMHCLIYGRGGGIELNLFMSLEIATTIWILVIIWWRVQDAEVSRLSSISTTGTNAVSGKYASSALGLEDRQRIQKKLQQLMFQEKLYLRNDLNLSKLSRTAGIAPYYLSQVINQDLNSNFYEWISSYRVAAAKQMLLENSGATIVEIANAVGFNSKSTFNLAFKKATGMTPSQYRAEIKSEPELAKSV